MDESTFVRQGEELSEAGLSDYLTENLSGFNALHAIRQFPGGYSNLTYLITTNVGDFVLRRPPFGTKARTAHDMAREFRILQALAPVYGCAPKPVLLCEAEEVLGAPFYLMQKVEGVILRNRIPEGLDVSPATMRRLSEVAVDNLVKLHAIDLEKTGLSAIGRPDGYVQRQVDGWVRRFEQARTEEVDAMDELAGWLQAHLPMGQAPALLHNDYKYDNLVFDSSLQHIRAVLDWEMCAVGDPLMDVGVMLGYWIQPGEAEAVVHSVANLTWLPGNLSRRELADRYAEKSGRNMQDLLFYYIFGVFKIGVIVQQIYYRYRQGFTRDARFASLQMVVQAFSHLGRTALEYGAIR
ncbi:MAG: phosphotransferase family protein [Haliscomenobacter sp.]